MSPFIPTGDLTVAASVNCVVKMMQGESRAPPLTENERATLLNWRSWLYQKEHPRPKPVTPVPKVGDRGVFVAHTPGEKYPHRLVEAESPRPNVTPEEIEALIEKESTFKEQQRAAEETLRQLIYAGRVPWEIITEDGARIALPKHLSGGDQWYEALRSDRITFRPGILSVSGFPVIPRNALEAAFNPDGTVKEEPEPVAPATEGAAEQDDNSIQTVAKKTKTHQRDKQIYRLYNVTLKDNPQEKQTQIFELMKKKEPKLFINRRTATRSETITDARIRHIILEQRQL